MSHLPAQPADLPFIDEIATTVGEEPGTVWRALLDVPGAGPQQRGAAAVAKLLGCRYVEATGPCPVTEGATIPGFVVAEATPPSCLRLEGDHRFSRYALVLRVDPAGSGRSRLRAETRAAFPGPLGRLYRVLVIGTGGHRVAVRRLLRAVSRRARRLGSSDGAS